MAGQKAENAKDGGFFSNARRAETQARRGNVVPRKVSRDALQPGAFIKIYVASGKE
jgi:hypothetical protein